MSAQTPPPRQRRWSLNSRATRGIIYQVIALVLVAGGVWFLALITAASVVLAFEWAAMSAPHARRLIGGAVSLGVVAALPRSGSTPSDSGQRLLLTPLQA